MATLATAVQLAEPSAKAFDEAEVQKICSIATELDKIPSVALQKQEALIKEIKAAYEAELIAFLAAEQEEDANASTLYKAVAAASGACGAAAAQQLEGLQKVALLATVNAGKATGAINEFVDFLIAVSTGGSTGTCLAASNGSPSGSNAQSRLGCPAKTTDNLNPAEFQENSALKPSGYAQFSGGTAHQSGGSADTKCFLLKTNGASSATNVWQTNTVSPQPLMFGFLTVTSHNTAGTTAINKATLNALGTNWEKTNPQTAPEKLFNAIGHLIKAEYDGCGQTATDILNHVIGKGKAAQLITSVRKGAKLTDKTSKNDYGAAALVDDVAGDSKNQAEKIKNKIDSLPVTQVQVDKTAEKTIKTNSNPEDMRKSLLLRHIKNKEAFKNLGKQLQEEIVKKANTVTTKMTETDATCAQKGTGAECKDGCKVEGTGDNNIGLYFQRQIQENIPYRSRL
ncbi:Trypanosome variant surface glycoprotein (A-type), putative [Trypanosoma equiperdum]|uniref:Trypanosome variant surface glycoprotein (A-type), putative n=1 Tax=Trypanosoma equiperdum TaxID=5694 RepID=A0A1G4I659_TRYEQ|nr:Trypanosome variant surface glycoprotein (A-type), putative [Trypanosoma equiperdum]